MKSPGSSRTSGAASTWERRLERAGAGLQALRGKINRRRLPTREAFEATVAKVVEAHKVEGMIGFSLQEHVELLRKKLGKGRREPNSQYVTEEKVFYSLQVWCHQKVIEEKVLLDGIFLLVSNHDPQEWPASRLLGLYKRQYKVEESFMG